MSLREREEVRLEFLEVNGLLAAEQRRKAMESLSDLLEPMREILSGDVDDPRLMEALDTWVHRVYNA